MALPLLIARRLLLQGQHGFAAFIIRLAVAATALGVAVMLLSLAFISGFKTTIQDKLFAFWGQALVVPATTNLASVAPADAVVYDPLLLQEILKTNGVQSATPFVLQSVIIQAGGQMEGVRLKGVPPQHKPGKDLSINGSFIQFPDSGYAREIVLSKTTADRLLLAPGDSALLYFIETGQAAPRARKVRLRATYHTGMEELDKQFGLCDIRLLQRLAGWDATDITGYQITLHEATDASIVAKEIDQRYVRRPLKAYPISEVYEGLYAWLALQDVNGIVLLLIISLVAIINLSSALLLLLADRTAMIAMLKTLGMPPVRLRAAFIWLGAFVGLAGTGVGLLLGVGLGLAQQRFGLVALPEATYYMSRVPVQFVGWQIALVAAGIPLLCLACMALPALYIGRINAARALQRR